MINLYLELMSSTEDFYNSFAAYNRYEVLSLVADESVDYYRLANESVMDTLKAMKDKIVNFILTVFRRLKEICSKVWDKVLRFLNIRTKRSHWNRADRYKKEHPEAANRVDASYSKDDSTDFSSSEGNFSLIFNGEGVVSYMASKMTEVRNKLMKWEETIPEMQLKKNIKVDQLVKKTNSVPRNGVEFLKKQVTKIDQSIKDTIEKFQNQMTNAAEATKSSNAEYLSYFKKGLRIVVTEYQNFFASFLPKVVLKIAKVANGASEEEVDKVYNEIKEFLSEDN